MMADRPLPVRDHLNRYYWDGALQEKLVLLRCPECNTYVHPPTELCSQCRHAKLMPSEVSGRGRLYSWSVMHSGGNPGFEEKIPYAVLVVELEEQPSLFTIGNLLDGDASELTIGAPVEVCFERITDKVTLPQWRLAR
jgi:uncharacterized OB-fold protein